MIIKISIENFRCIRELEMDLEPLTVLVGPNASGKSSMLAALTATTFPSTDRGTFGNNGVVIRRYQGDTTPEELRLGFSLNRIRARAYQFELPAMRSGNEVQLTRQLAGNGGNLTNAFANLPRRDQASVAKGLAALVDALGDVDARPGRLGEQRLVFQDRWNEDVWFEASQVSDGTMMVLAFLVLQHQKQRPTTVCIEEPERGLHPYLLGKIIDLLRSISQGKHGPATQFVLATQSAELLDHVEPHEVRFLERDADGGVQVRTAPTDDEAWANAIETYENSIGQMWLSGSLGGVPG